MQIFKSKTNNRLMIPLLVLWAVCLVIKLVLYFLLSMDSISSSCRVYSLFGQYDIFRRFLDFLQDLTYGDIILPSIILMALFYGSWVVCMTIGESYRPQNAIG